MVPVEEIFWVMSSTVALPVSTAMLCAAAFLAAAMRLCTKAPPSPRTASAMTARRMFRFAPLLSPFFFGFTSSATACPLSAYGST